MTVAEFTGNGTIGIFDQKGTFFPGTEWIRSVIGSGDKKERTLDIGDYIWLHLCRKKD